ncbi:Organic cation/carnitine transporter [Quillaja saponaria]|uniref:Organic cation/carnitine transporter n=1 Tax=Quillaja saponaria TaxID=32244 RepID=A0AAD7PB53_QUISA|nr:Organic cation/carnitine transporter [Quillaja saponaria]
MADSTPLLPQQEASKHDNLVVSFEELVEQSIGGFNRAQFFQAILVSLAFVFDGQQTFISVFSDAIPTWHCVNNTTTYCKPNHSNICKLPRSSWTWDGPASQSFISEWELQCANSIIKGLPTSSFFIGCLVGGFALATLADSFLGRKKLLVLSCLTMSLAALVTNFSTNLWMYSALRFISGIGRASIGTCTVVLLTEKVGRKWRGRVGIMGFFAFAMGFLSLPGISYIDRGHSWKFLYFWTSIPAIFYCVLLHIFLVESPRWLFMQGHIREAMAAIQALSEADMNSTYICETEQKRKTDFYSSIKSLFKKRWALKRLFGVMVISFGLGMVYYGIPLGIGNLGFNIYLSVVFNALMEVPSYLISFLFIESWKRKTSLLFFCITSGMCSLMCAITGSSSSGAGKGIKIGLELACFFCACTALNVLVIFTVELFPTSVRNTATSMARQAQVFGGALCPILISAGRENEFVSYGMFGLVIICSVLFVASLPETRGTMLCDTMDEQECKDCGIM